MEASAIPRRALALVLEALEDSRVVLVHGPRQSGKTTVAREVLRRRSGRFETLDDPASLEAALRDPAGFLEGEGLLVLDEGQVAAILGLLLGELRGECRTAVAFDGETAHEDLVAERRRPGGPPLDPRAQRPAAARGDLEEPSHARADRDVAPHDQSPVLEVVQDLVDLADVGMPERSQPLVERLEKLVAVRLAVGEQSQQRVS